MPGRRKQRPFCPARYAPDVAVTPGFSSESRTVVVTVYWQLPGETEKHQHVMTAQIGKNP